MKQALNFLFLITSSGGVLAGHSLQPNAQDPNIEVQAIGAAIALPQPAMFIGDNEQYQVSEGKGCGCEALPGGIDQPVLTPLCQPDDDKGSTCR